MRILLVTESYWPNADGGALFERRLVLGLIGRGHHVAVWAPADKFAGYVEQDGPYRIFRERAVKFWANTKYRVSFAPFMHARRVIREERPDVIHIHNLYWMGLSAMFWAKRYKIPLVATNHFMPENALLNLKGTNFLYGPLHGLIWHYLVSLHNRADYVTTPTPTALALLQEHGLRAPSKPVSNGIDMEVFKPGLETAAVTKKYGLATDRPVILYFGRLDGEKRLDQILDALPKVLVEQKAQLVLCGFGKAMDGLKAQAKKLGIEKDIVFTGYVDEDEKPHIYNAATVFVISSPAELQSIVLLEAMASGKPVVSVDVAALKELCHDGKNGYLFKLEDVDGLAKALTAIIGDQGLAKRFGKESTNIVQRHHSTLVMFETYEAVYQHLLRKGAA